MGMVVVARVTVLGLVVAEVTVLGPGENKTLRPRPPVIDWVPRRLGEEGRGVPPWPRGARSLPSQRPHLSQPLCLPLLWGRCRLPGTKVDPNLQLKCH